MSTDTPLQFYQMPLYELLRESKREPVQLTPEERLEIKRQQVILKMGDRYLLSKANHVPRGGAGERRLDTWYPTLETGAPHGDKR